MALVTLIANIKDFITGNSDEDFYEEDSGPLKYFPFISFFFFLYY